MRRNSGYPKYWTAWSLAVAENIFLGHEAPFVHMGIKDTRAMNREAQKLLDSYGFGRISYIWLAVVEFSGQSTVKVMPSAISS